MSKKHKKTEMAQNEFILSLTTAIGDLETRLQACEQWRLLYRRNVTG